MRLHKTIFNSVMKGYLTLRHRRIDDIRQNPIGVQKEVFENIINKGEHTIWGNKHSFGSVNSEIDFSKACPVTDYDILKEYIHRMMLGEENVLWPGRTTHFAKSSGTTSDKSKFIPVTDEKLKKNHIGASWDAVTILYGQRPDAKVFEEKNLIMGGTLTRFEENKETIIGDVSAIMLDQMPIVGKPFYTPDFETALMEDWEKKLDKMVDICVNEKVSMIGGVPTWTIVLFRKILEKTGAQNIHEVWPNLVAYFHGGVAFNPYKEQFKSFLPQPSMDYLEIYNASEGYFGIQDRFERDDMLLLLDNGVYYEFIPREEWGKENPETINLVDVELGKSYALVISTVAGLWRYQPGDTVCFTSRKPYRIKITGRTKQFINVFGEEVMVSNTDMAIQLTNEEFGSIVSEYTVAPIFIKEGEKGGHQWIIEFEKKPSNLIKYQEILDLNLQKVNSDYEAKRFKDMALQELQIVDCPKGTFWTWMQIRGKVGGQNKVPRLSNERKYIDGILDLIK